MRLVIKTIFFFISKIRHYRVVSHHWFWRKHYQGNLKIRQLKLSDLPLDFIIENEAMISIGSKTYFSGTSKLLAIHNGKITIGEGCYFNRNCSINALEHISIDSNCLFGENVKLYDHNHRFSNSSKLIKDQGYTTAPITIGQNTWVGSNAIILKGVQIGANVVIAAGSIVNMDVPDNSILSASGLKPINHQ